jgi:hypothetical protein
MSVAELKLRIDELSPEERSELLEHLGRGLRDRERKLRAADEAMKRIDSGGGVPLDTVWAVMEERDRAQP